MENSIQFSIERKHWLACLGQRSTNFLPRQSARGERAAPRAETTKPVERTRDVKRLSRLHHPKDKRRHRSFIHYHEIPFRNGLVWITRSCDRVYVSFHSGTILASCFCARSERGQKWLTPSSRELDVFPFRLLVSNSFIRGNFSSRIKFHFYSIWKEKEGDTDFFEPNDLWTRGEGIFFFFF